MMPVMCNAIYGLLRTQILHCVHSTSLFSTETNDYVRVHTLGCRPPIMSEVPSGS